jgi:hypothetical protein
VEGLRQLDVFFFVAERTVESASVCVRCTGIKGDEGETLAPPPVFRGGHEHAANSATLGSPIDNEFAHVSVEIASEMPPRRRCHEAHDLAALFGHEDRASLARVRVNGLSHPFLGRSTDRRSVPPRRYTLLQSLGQA